MNNLYRLVCVGTLFMLFSYSNAVACGFDFVGSCASAVSFTANGAPKDYFVTSCTYGNSLSGSSIGTNLTTLNLSSATTVSWESCTNFLQESNAYFRVFNNPANKGAFQKISLTQQSIITSSPPYRTRTYSNNLSIDLLAGLLPNTTYTFEIYYQIGADSDGNGTVDQTKVYDNGGSYFSATFQTGNIVVDLGFPMTITPQNAVCKGGNGSATASPSGGTAPYTFAWSNGATGATVTGLHAGNYSVTATDSTASKSIKSFIISEPAIVSASLSTTNPSCGIANGSIIASGLGGTSPYTFLWDDNATTSSILNLSSGVYNVTITDSKGCKGSGSTNLTENCGGSGSYCTTAGSPWNEWIARVQFNTLDNTSDKTRPDRYIAGYSDWSDKKTNAARGASYPLSITPGLSWSGQQSNLYFRAWIDFNKNGIFEDSEKVFEKNALNIAVTNPVLIPSTALLGTTILRISMKKDSYPTACESFAAGEVEDYSLTIVTGNGDPCTTDSIKPVLSACPLNVGLVTTSNCGMATWVAPTATDNCTPNPSVTSNFASGFCFPIGTSTVIYTATDAKNNTTTCSFNVTISGSSCMTDSVKPILSPCPSNISLATPQACETVIWTPPTATDNCTSNPSVTSNFASGFCFPVGTTHVIYTATDAKNNTSTCDFNVLVTTGTNTQDIDLTVTASKPTFSKWETANFTVSAKNDGAMPFTNVKIEFKFPTGTVNGGNSITSVGIWEPWCTGNIECFTWTIPSLNAHTTATLNLPLFILDVITPITATAKLLSSTPTDTITANNIASVTINPITNTVLQSLIKPTESVPVVIEHISPSFTDGDISLTLESNRLQQAVLLISDAFGRVVKIDKQTIEKGHNTLRLDVSDLPQGLYFIAPATNKGQYYMPTKFIKL